ncbi:hypothetical protein LR48_Vigan02g272700 [Vigna angularis]|uniref:C2H2-type domain-containing protein n=1 Tax=Phaseolus angularis TaxID=3914 RepID=A0A0L9U1N6_PHAAN|nr:pollen-specific leucine-rich repeat extensin-like protein 3 [Vigna angularis]KAG2400987.1 uncharacterized protein HKW66_Vig0199770 [Vigna angularis]KOM36577.1 hypothetical protein LR48_Vigan02g272700 [Vigna angularis]
MSLNSFLSGSNPTTMPILKGSYSRETVHVAPPPIITNVKASDLLKQQLLSVPALAKVLGGTSSRSTARPQPAPPLRLHRFLDDFPSETPQKSTPQKAREAATVTNKDTETEKKYDGRIHSNPHKKNGPYTCPKCKGVFDTSQRFASHASSIHYKFESKGERKKRLTARYYKRNPRVEWVNGKPTIVWGNNKNSVVVPPPHPPPRVLPKTECVVEELLPPPGFGKPIPPPPGFGKPIPPLGFGKPILPPPGFGKPIPPPLGFEKPILPPPPGFGKPILPPPPAFGKPILPPPPGFGKPIPPPPGFENVNYGIPGFHLPFRFHQKLTGAVSKSNWTFNR